MTALLPPRGQIVDRVHHFPVRVYYEDTDAGGVVYHASYIRFLERARTEFLRAAGISHAALAALDPPVVTAVARLETDFLSPARLEDLLIVRTAFLAEGRARLPIAQEIVCEDRILIRARLDVACVTPGGGAVKPPKMLVNALAPYRGGVLKST